MPPRIPSRVFASVPFSNGAVASSSTSPPPPARSPSIDNRRNFSSHSHSGRLRPKSPEVFRAASTHPEQKRSFHSSSPQRASVKDPYAVLGVKKEASASDIKKAYYQLAKKWHPDSNKDTGANEKFVEVQTAYDILSDDNKRQAFDRYGAASTQEGFDADAFARGAGGFGGFQDFGSAFGGRAGNAGDLFESLFGGAFGGGGPFAGAGRSRPMRGDPIEVAVSVSFLDACNGTTRKLNITPVVDCHTCEGSGLKPGQKRTQCSTCRGTGNQTFQFQGTFMSTTCTACEGQGSTIPRNARCSDCEGVGRVKEKKEVVIDIPAGIEDGMKIAIPGMGDMPLSGMPGGQRGDLNVRVNVRSSPVFRRQGTNLYHDAKVPLHTALLGGRVRIPTLEGEVEVKVREGTQNGEEAVLKGRGVKALLGLRGDRDQRGDLVVSWKVQVPRSLTPLQKKIMQAYADDVEGRPTSIRFSPPDASSSATGSNGTAPSSSQSTPASQSSTASSSESPDPPVVETERRPPPDERPDSAASQAEGLGDKVASALGGALGWAERLFGSDKDKDKDKGGGKGR